MWRRSLACWSDYYLSLVLTNQNILACCVLRRPFQVAWRQTRERFILDAKELGARGQWKEVLRRLEEIVESGTPMSSTVYNCAIRSLAKNGR